MAPVTYQVMLSALPAIREGDVIATRAVGDPGPRVLLVTNTPEELMTGARGFVAAVRHLWPSASFIVQLDMPAHSPRKPRWLQGVLTGDEWAILRHWAVRDGQMGDVASDDTTWPMPSATTADGLSDTTARFIAENVLESLGRRQRMAAAKLSA